MTIKALSPVSYSNKNYNTQSKNSVSQSQSINTSSSSFELPSCNVSFGARININSLKNDKRLEEKYFPDSSGFLPNYYSDQTKLLGVVYEFQSQDPKLVEKYFTLKHGNDKQLIAHKPSEGILKVMNDNILKLENGEDILKKIYTTPDKNGNLPAHTFVNGRDHEEMTRVLDKETLAEIYTTKNEDGFKPADLVKNDGDYGYIIKLFKDNKETLNKIVFTVSAPYEEPPALHGPEDLNAILDAYKDEPESIRQFFVDKDIINNTEYLKYTLLSHVESGKEDEYLNVLNNRLIDTNPAILKDIYTLKDKVGLLFQNRLINNGDNNILAKNMMQLITDSDLNEKDSLEVLRANREFLSEKNIEDLDLIEQYLISAVKNT